MVFHPLMPKGVEHETQYPPLCLGFYVFHPLMPKGVEHFAKLWLSESADDVFHPLMPKGVEHFTTSRRLIPVASCFIR